jgi:hypothetical protein
MRDIRGDLQDRANLLEEQVNAAQAQFEKLIEQLKREHESRTEELKSELEAVTTLMELEHRRLASVASGPKVQPMHPQTQGQHQAQAQHQPQAQAQHQPQAHPQPPHPQPHPQAQAQAQAQAQPHPHAQAQSHPHAQAQAQQPLADFLVRKLSEVGAMSREDLRRLAMQEGYFADGDSAERGVHLTLVNVVKAGLARQLPNGNFAPATVMDTIRLRRAI